MSIIIKVNWLSQTDILNQLHFRPAQCISTTRTTPMNLSWRLTPIVKTSYPLMGYRFITTLTRIKCPTLFYQLQTTYLNYILKIGSFHIWNPHMSNSRCLICPIQDISLYIVLDNKFTYLYLTNEYKENII